MAIKPGLCPTWSEAPLQIFSQLTSSSSTIILVSCLSVRTLVLALSSIFNFRSVTDLCRTSVICKACKTSSEAIYSQKIHCSYYYSIVKQVHQYACIFLFTNHILIAVFKNLPMNNFFFSRSTNSSRALHSKKNECMKAQTTGQLCVSTQEIQYLLYLAPIISTRSLT